MAGIREVIGNRWRAFQGKVRNSHFFAGYGVEPQQSSLAHEALLAALSNATAKAQTPAGNSAVTPGNITVYTSPIVGYPAFLNAASAALVFYNSQEGVPEQISATFYRS